MEQQNQMRNGEAPLISIKMRAAQGGPHERGGRHIPARNGLSRRTGWKRVSGKCWSGRGPTSGAAPIS